ncbi:hypothetical protein BDV41DRAFT_556453 [Aspergillus transmontanensis]|uniref:Uncharacterized protein n=1 Tax=Aspergillus transmontanensis TaxID=1034304 RepID=A0A5N6VER0_9EURO|nr:hypothetical protein BDV41DRAFT_556453 [Aspergillus transmontanensis]
MAGQKMKKTFTFVLTTIFTRIMVVQSILGNATFVSLTLPHVLTGMYPCIRTVQTP